MASNKRQLTIENSVRRESDDDDDGSRSGSENFEVSDESNLAPVAPPAPGGKPYRRKKYNRHTTFQIQELEGFFKKCPHPDERQRTELGRKLGMDSKQVKFWFQNRRTQMKTQLERHENVLLKQEFDKLKMENMALKEYIFKPLCKECGGDAVQISIDEHRLRMDNAQLKQELIRVCEIAENLLGKPVSEMVSSFYKPQLGLSVGESSSGLTSGGSHCLAGPELEDLTDMPPSMCVVFNDYEKSSYLQVAIAAMDELIALAQNDSPYWLRSLDGNVEVFNHGEYVNKFNPYGMSSPGFTFEASRDCGAVIINSLELIDTLMHPGRWVDMFPCMVGKASIISVLSTGFDGTHDGELLLLEAEMLFPSPFIPMRRLRFIRYCKKYSEGAWAVVDISVEPLQEGNADITKRCRRLPSGFCILQDVTNSFSVVTCVEHAEYDHRVVHSLYRPLVQSGFGFGAHRWLATLQRQCEYAAYHPASGITPLESSIGITPHGKKSLLRLSRRIINEFCAGVCASPEATKWKPLNLGDMTPNLQFMTRVSMDKNGEVSGMILSFSTALLMPLPRHQVFDFLRNGQLRGHWDMLANEGPMEETVRITKSINAANSETWDDKANSVVVYSTVDVSSLTQVMGGGDPRIVNLCPSGLVITDTFMGPDDGSSVNVVSSLLTLGFQTTMSTSPTTSLTLDSIETVKEVMAQTIDKLKKALHCDQDRTSGTYKESATFSIISCFQ
ncbi:hypothetical protein V2J09_001751 [Rumex salicifolius]